MTTEQLIAYYQNLLIIQYKTMPKALATIGAISSQIVANQLTAQVRDGFDVLTAIGAQLDVLGKYVGAQRSLPDYTPTAEYMAFPLYAAVDPEDSIGFSLYADAEAPVGEWLLYNTTGITLTMSDGQLRSLIQYLVAVHASDHSNESLDEIFAEFFLGYVTITDNGDMTVTYTHDSADPFILFDIVEFIGALPRPAGVEIIVVTV